MGTPAGSQIALRVWDDPTVGQKWTYRDCSLWRDWGGDNPRGTGAHEVTLTKAG